MGYLITACLTSLFLLTTLSSYAQSSEEERPDKDAPKGLSLEVRRFGLKEAVNRVGVVEVLQAEIVNSGDEDARDITVRLRGNESERSISSLSPGRKALLSWEVTATRPGKAEAVLDIQCGFIRETVKTELRWYRSVKAVPTDHVPEPKPVRGEFEVGVYYFPGWQTYGRWSVLDEYPERRPVLGYYREGDPDVADWHIKWMVEHGITFIIYDWYWSDGARQLEHALHDGFFKAKYRDKIKFCLLWANHNPPGTTSFEDIEKVTEYWLDNYFLRPEHLTIDGKPVVIIFSPYRLTEDLGGPDAVRQALDRSREMARDRGLPGIYFMACTWPVKDQVAALGQSGYDALTGYNYPTAGDKGQIRAPYADMVSGYEEIWNQIADMSSIPYVPVTDPGWDSRPWDGPAARVRTGKTPALFRTMLDNAKRFVNKRTPDADPKMVLVEAWNEFGEGDYIEPHREFGFEYLDAIRAVFTSAPANRVQLIPRDVGLGPYEIPKPEPITLWDFTDPLNSGWEGRRQLGEVEVTDGLITGVSIGDDPNFHCDFVSIDAEEFPVVEIRMSVDKGTMGQLFWHAPGMGFAETTSKRFDLIADGRFHVYRLGLASTSFWKSDIAGLRFDPTNVPGDRIAIDYIRFVSRSSEVDASVREE